MLRAYKTEIKPTEAQKQRIHQTIGVCRFVYNLYLAHNKSEHEAGRKFKTAYDFSKWLNNEYVPSHPEHAWIKSVSSKSVKQSICNAETAFKKFFRKESRYPRFKKRKHQDVSMYFVKNDANTPIQCERHRIKIPTLGWVRLKEFGYLPTDGSIKSGTVSIQAGRYYVSVLAEVEAPTRVEPTGEPLGIDIGVQDFAILSDGTVHKNMNKSTRTKKLNKKLKREQRRLSRKYEAAKKERNLEERKATRQNIQKQILSVQKCHQRIANARNDYQNKIVSNLVKTKPSSITIEDLNVRGMMANRHLSRAIAEQGFNSFVTKLTNKAHAYGIEVRKVDRFYPSSKTCHNCGQIKRDLKLSDRTYKCDCGYECDRDLNAAKNLRDATAYKVA